MAEAQMQSVVYLALLLAVIAYFTLGGYRGNWPAAGKHILIWAAIFGVLFIVLHLAGY
ncbi:MAG: hypothetical protein AAGA36_08115 [Pseudomonadota bacterium]